MSAIRVSSQAQVELSQQAFVLAEGLESSSM